MKNKLFGFYSKNKDDVLGSQKWKMANNEIVIINGLSISNTIDENLLKLSEFNVNSSDYKLIGEVLSFCGINKLPPDYMCYEQNYLADLNDRIKFKNNIKHGYFDPSSDKNQTWLNEFGEEVIITEVIEDIWFTAKYNFQYSFTEKQYIGKITRFVKFN